MAGPDPRRSSRARTSQPQSRPSSTTSSVSGRADRAPKAFAKIGSPQKSTPSVSLASEPPDDAGDTDDTPPPQLRTRRAAQASSTREDDAELTSVVVSEIEMLNDGDDIQEDDEAVRCICGYEDYPGPPAPDDLKHAAKDGFDVDTIFPSVVTDDLAGFFVQCDICKVWQHGACVGLVNDNTLPEEYYCEECRKDLHKIFPSTHGPRCSIYLALNRRRSRTGSFGKDHERSPKLRESSKDNAKESKEPGAERKEGRSGRSATSASSKRRSTMNSRDAAYDEEQLRIAIEASKEDVTEESPDSGARRPKRSRSDSEEKTEGVKRQRTSSRSATPERQKSTGADDSDDAVATRNGSKKSRTAVRSQQQREKTEKEEKERQRAEAANKRNGRAERRRADGIDATQEAILIKGAAAHSDTDSDPSDEVPLAARTGGSRSGGTQATAAAPATSSAAPAASVSSSAAPSATGAPRSGPPRPSQPSPETPPPTSAPAMSASKSKGGRPTHKKKGRNQYTKEREAREEQNARSRSRDVQDSSHGKSGSGGGGHGNKSGSRAKGGMNSRITMTEMKRRVSAMFDFISKTQVELAGEEEAGPAEGGKEGKEGGDAKKTQADGEKRSGSPTAKAGGNGEDGAGELGKEFKSLSCVEMMDSLTRDIVHWQNQFAA